MKNNRVKKEKNKKDEKYLIKDVETLEVTFNDGTTTKLNTSCKDELVLMRVYPNSMIQNPFMLSVITNYSIDTNGEELAKKCGYDCFRTFQRHFKKNFKTTVYNWILNRKMDYIHSLVTNTDLSISEISDLFHYKNHAHLSSSYKKHFGISPSKDREQELEN